MTDNEEKPTETADAETASTESSGESSSGSSAGSSDGSPDEATPQQAANEAADAFKQGMGLLWKAARSAADEIKREVDKGGVNDALQKAGRDLESAAGHAAKAIEDFVDRVGPSEPKWSDPKAAGFDSGNPKGAAAEQVDAESPEDGGVDEETGERRDMRIQVEDD
jgi:hypothetical protein